MSVLSRKDYFVNLRKSYHVHAHSVSETHIFLDNNSADKLDENIDNLIHLKCLIEVDLSRIDNLLGKLEDKLEQYKFGLPTLLISGEQEIYRQSKDEIETLCLKIKGQLESSFHKQQQQSIEHNDQQLKSNLGAHLANRLTDQFEKFQVFQKMFNGILYERVKSTSTNVTVTKPTIDVESSPELCQLVLDEGHESMLKERSQEIDQVITDTLHVHEVLNQIQVMTVQQGSLFDRIDVNLDQTRRNLGKTIVTLERTAESFSLHQKRLILFFITLAIFVVSLLILWR